MPVSALELDNVKTYFPVAAGAFKRKTGVIKAVDGVSLTVAEGDILGIVGESGCGKSTLARSIMRLVSPIDGTIRLFGQNIIGLSHKQLQQTRRTCQMIFQDPYASLNPRMTVFDAVAEPMLVHGLATRRSVTQRVAELLEHVGLAARYMRKYPHEFSGGQRQRVAIARALALEPRIILADEPVSALDVSVQAQILNLISELCRSKQITLALISHDLAVVHYLAQRIAVMYLGRVVELGDAEQVFHEPLHPYTQCLLSAIPRMPMETNSIPRPHIGLRGDPPSPINPPEGCPFHPRCPWAIPECAVKIPPLEEKRLNHKAACIRIPVETG